MYEILVDDGFSTYVGFRGFWSAGDAYKYIVDNHLNFHQKCTVRPSC